MLASVILFCSRAVRVDGTTELDGLYLDAERVRSIEASIEQRLGTSRILFGVFHSWWVDMV